MHHVWQFIVSQPEAANLPRFFSLFTIFKFGPLGVTVFIVLSGYCLMLPVARAPDYALAGGVSGFIARRARRILPPYYATVVCSILLILAFPVLGRPTLTQWDIALPALSSESLLTHALLLHNVSETLQWKLNPPLWSVALEWQIYFLFALLLLPLWRRFGALWALALAFGLGFLPLLWSSVFAHTWFLGSFALGMLAAALNFDPKLKARPKLVAFPWLRVSLLFAAPVALSLPFSRRVPLPDVLVESCLSIATAAWLVHATERLTAGRPSLVTRFFSHPWCVKLGEFSYSSYLVHYPLLAVLFLLLQNRGLSLMAQFFVLSSAGLLAMLSFSYGFHRVFERPFMRPSAPKKAVTAA